MNACCPSCGHKLIADHAPIDALVSAPLSRTDRAIVSALARAYPGDLAIDEIMQRLFINRGSLPVQISNLRKRLRPFGWTIPSSKSGRGHYGSYRLKLMDQVQPKAPVQSDRSTR